MLDEHVRRFDIVIPSSGDDAVDLAAFRAKCQRLEATCFASETARPALLSQLTLDVPQGVDLGAEVLNELPVDGFLGNIVPIDSKSSE